MNQSESRFRKLVYLGFIVLLLIPIVVLGMPGGGRFSTPGVLSSMRSEFELGESDIGKIDPTSAAMNMVLLGFRGIAVNTLWANVEHYKNTKNWELMKSTTDAIVRLQPHFISVWRFTSWNLAFNVSAEFDGVKDRFNCVKDGAIFLQNGIDINGKNPDLAWEEGRIIGFKIGMSDEARYFRKFFKSDPDVEQFKGGPDPKINEQALDNYLVARDWYIKANDRELNQRQRILDRTLFRSYPARSYFDYAAALQKDGVFGEQTRVAWDDAYRDWTTKYGREIFRVPEIPEAEMWMEMSEDDISGQVKTGDEERRLRKAVDDYQKIVNYRYWRDRARCERDPQMADAHREIYEAQVAYGEQRLTEAKALVESGMKNFGDMLKKYPDLLAVDDLLLEDALTAVLMWQYILKLSGDTPTDDYPLKVIWDSQQGRLPDVQARLDRWLLEQSRNPDKK